MGFSTPISRVIYFSAVAHVFPAIYKDYVTYITPLWSRSPRDPPAVPLNYLLGFRATGPTRKPAILAITHQLQMAKVADQVLVLSEGQVQELGSCLKNTLCWQGSCTVDELMTRDPAPT